MIKLKIENFNPNKTCNAHGTPVCVPFFPFGHSDNFYSLNGLTKFVDDYNESYPNSDYFTIELRMVQVKVGRNHNGLAIMGLILEAEE